jgi:hypothetical protein
VLKRCGELKRADNVAGITMAKGPILDATTHCQILNDFQKRNYCLQINPPGQAPLFYAADSEPERQQWFEVLQRTLQNLSKQPNGPGGGNPMPSPVDSSIKPEDLEITSEIGRGK